MSVGSAEDLMALQHHLLLIAQEAGARMDFFHELGQSILRATSFDGLEMALQRLGRAYTYQATLDTEAWLSVQGEARVSLRAHLVAEGHRSTGTSWYRGADPASSQPVFAVLLPLSLGGQRLGELLLTTRHAHLADERNAMLLEDLARSVATSIAHYAALWALRERVKELTCLNELSRLDQPDLPLAEMLRKAVAILPAGWQHSAICTACIKFDDEVFAIENHERAVHRQRAEIVLRGRRRGYVEVAYGEQRVEMDEGPFMLEERTLLEQVATQLALLLERRISAEENERLQAQLRHADRLATVGQLAAGTAHELNEPIVAVLGFAQLAKKHAALPPEVNHDLDRIVGAALRARDVIRHLMLFARQTPPQMTTVQLNTIVAEALALLDARLAEQQVRVVRKLENKLPAIWADPGLMHQALVNLFVNAVHAMPNGGTLTVSTAREAQGVRLTIQDTGMGMTLDVATKIFLPFYTTKDVGEGTGLGLSVVHGILSAHGASIDVASEPGHGARFDIHLPIGRRPSDGT